MLALAALKACLFTQGEMPDSGKVFEENDNLASRMSQLEPPWAEIALLSLAKILQRLQISGNYRWSRIITRLFAQVDYSNYSEAKLEGIFAELVGVVLIGGEYSLLKPMFERKHFDKPVRNALAQIKPWLEYSFPRVPSAYRERLRKVLNDLEDISPANE